MPTNLFIPAPPSSEGLRWLTKIHTMKGRKQVGEQNQDEGKTRLGKTGPHRLARSGPRSWPAFPQPTRGGGPFLLPKLLLGRAARRAGIGGCPAVSSICRKGLTKPRRPPAPEPRPRSLRGLREGSVEGWLALGHMLGPAPGRLGCCLGPATWDRVWQGRKVRFSTQSCKGAAARNLRALHLTPLAAY